VEDEDESEEEEEEDDWEEGEEGSWLVELGCCCCWVGESTGAGLRLSQTFCFSWFSCFLKNRSTSVIMFSVFRNKSRNKIFVERWKAKKERTNERTKEQPNGWVKSRKPNSSALVTTASCNQSDF
jgi:hypothetical protein